MRATGPWNTTGTVANYLLQGVPASKIVVGVPFYGNQYINVSATSQHGLYGTFDNTGLDPNSLQPDQMPQPTYHDLVDVAGDLTANGKGANGYTAYWDMAAGESYLASPNATHALASGTITTPTVITTSTPALDRRAYGPRQGTSPARRDGLGNQPGLRLARADLRTRPILH